MNRLVRQCAALLILTGLAWVRVEAGAPAAPDLAASKIRLLAAALHARDTGDVAAARRNLEELLALSPNDETVKRLLTSLDRMTQKAVTVAGGATALDEADELARAEEERLNRLLEAAGTALKEARALSRQNHYAAALDAIDRTQASLPENNLTKGAVAELGLAKAEIVAAREKYLLPPPPPPAPAGDDTAILVARGRSQYLAGESAAAAETFRQAETQDPGNTNARYFLKRIASETAAGSARTRASSQMMSEVDQAWQRPGAIEPPPASAAAATGRSPLVEKLNSIVLPNVNFSGMELSRVVNTLSVISEEFDHTGASPKGVNIVLLDPANTNPVVSITLRNLPLKRVLDFITGSVGYQYEVQADAVVVRPGGEQSILETLFFPVSRSTVLRMTGKGSAPTGGTDPLTGAPLAAPAASVESEGQAIRNFLQLAGVSFEGVTGSTLAFDGSQLIATQTPRNLERIRNILTRLPRRAAGRDRGEVHGGAAGRAWRSSASSGTSRPRPRSATPRRPSTPRVTASTARWPTPSATRRVRSRFPSPAPASPTAGSTSRRRPPTIPGGVLLGTAAGPLANITGNRRRV